MNLFHNLIDRVHIQQTDKIKAETVDMVFIRPLADGIHNVFPYHAALARRIISAAGTT